MEKRMTVKPLIVLVSALALMNPACRSDKKAESPEPIDHDGPMERAGEWTDEAAEDTADAVEDTAEDTADAVEGTAEDTERATEDAYD
jgi:hypothetical protein